MTQCAQISYWPVIRNLNNPTERHFDRCWPTGVCGEVQRCINLPEVHCLATQHSRPRSAPPSFPKWRCAPQQRFRDACCATDLSLGTCGLPSPTCSPNGGPAPASCTYKLKVYGRGVSSRNCRKMWLAQCKRQLVPDPPSSSCSSEESDDECDDGLGPDPLKPTGSETLYRTPAITKLKPTGGKPLRKSLEPKVKPTGVEILDETPVSTEPKPTKSPTLTAVDTIQISIESTLTAEEETEFPVRDVESTILYQALAEASAAHVETTGRETSAYTELKLNSSTAFQHTPSGMKVKPTESTVFDVTAVADIKLKPSESTTFEQTPSDTKLKPSGSKTVYGTPVGSGSGRPDVRESPSNALKNPSSATFDVTASSVPSKIGLGGPAGSVALLVGSGTTLERSGPVNIGVKIKNGIDPRKGKEDQEIVVDHPPGSMIKVMKSKPGVSPSVTQVEATVVPLSPLAQPVAPPTVNSSTHQLAPPTVKSSTQQVAPPTVNSSTHQVAPPTVTSSTQRVAPPAVKSSTQQLPSRTPTTKSSGDASYPSKTGAVISGTPTSTGSTRRRASQVEMPSAASRPSPATTRTGPKSTKSIASVKSYASVTLTKSVQKPTGVVEPAQTESTQPVKLYVSAKSYKYETSDESPDAAIGPERFLVTAPSKSDCTDTDNKIVEALRKKHTCPLCKEILFHAVKMNTCAHQFCRYCVLKYIQQNKSCPLCAKKFTGFRERPDIDACIDCQLSTVCEMYQKEREALVARRYFPEQQVCRAQTEATEKERCFAIAKGQEQLAAAIGEVRLEVEAFVKMVKNGQIAPQFQPDMVCQKLCDGTLSAGNELEVVEKKLVTFVAIDKNRIHQFLSICPDRVAKCERFCRMIKSQQGRAKTQSRRSKSESATSYVPRDGMPVPYPQGVMFNFRSNDPSPGPEVGPAEASRSNSRTKAEVADLNQQGTTASGTVMKPKVNKSRPKVTKSLIEQSASSRPFPPIATQMTYSQMMPISDYCQQLCQDKKGGRHLKKGKSASQNQLPKIKTFGTGFRYQAGTGLNFEQYRCPLPYTVYQPMSYSPFHHHPMNQVYDPHKYAFKLGGPSPLQQYASNPECRQPSRRVKSIKIDVARQIREIQMIGQAKLLEIAVKECEAARKQKPCPVHTDIGITCPEPYTRLKLFPRIEDSCPTDIVIDAVNRK